MNCHNHSRIQRLNKAQMQKLHNPIIILRKKPCYNQIAIMGASRRDADETRRISFDRLFSKEINMAGRFELKQAKDSQYMFNLKAGNGQIIGTSPMFADVAARDAAIAETQAVAKTATTA